jgi:hypothetical protein
MGYRLDSTAEGAIYTWVKKITEEYDPIGGMSVLWSRQKTPLNKANKPEKPFILLTVLEPPQPVGYGQARKIKKSETVTTRRKIYTFTVQVDILLENDSQDFDLVEYFHARKSFESTYIDMKSANLSILRMSGFADMTELISNGYENRSVFEITFAWYKDRDESVQTIENANGTGTFENVGGDEKTIDWETDN